jgi:hypothetical protein
MNEQLSIIGILLTLIGLLGSFYSIQLAAWYSRLIELSAMYQQNKRETDEIMKEKIRECRFLLRGVDNHVTALSSTAISAFILFCTGIAYWLSPAAEVGGVPLRALQAAWIAFLIVYFGLAVYFLARGYSSARALRIGLGRPPRER